LGLGFGVHGVEGLAREPLIPGDAPHATWPVEGQDGDQEVQAEPLVKLGKERNVDGRKAQAVAVVADQPGAFFTRVLEHPGMPGPKRRVRQIAVAPGHVGFWAVATLETHMLVAPAEGALCRLTDVVKRRRGRVEADRIGIVSPIFEPGAGVDHLVAQCGEVVAHVHPRGELFEAEQGLVDGDSRGHAPRSLRLGHVFVDRLGVDGLAARTREARCRSEQQHDR